MVVFADDGGATSEEQSRQSGAVGNSGDTMSIERCAKTSVGEVKRLIVCCVTFSARFGLCQIPFLFLLAQFNIVQFNSMFLCIS